MRHDYKFLSEQHSTTGRLLWSGKLHLLLLSVVAVTIFIAISLISDNADAKKSTLPPISKQIETVTTPTHQERTPDRIIEALPLPAEPQINSILRPMKNKAQSQKVSSGKWHTVKVRSGDNMAQIFDRLKLSPKVLHQIVHLNKNTRRLTRVLPGDKIRFLINEKQQLKKLIYQFNISKSLNISRSDGSFQASIITRKLERRITHSSGHINHSLFLAAQAAGMTDNMTMQLANIFGWDVDFALDIRKGDHFTVIYEEIYLDDKKIRDGDIIAAEFTNRGHAYRAIRFTDKNGRSQYYAPNGRSMRKAFLRTPVDFSRISSRFSLGRKHPILNRIRAHKGVDYAARRGTPIKATGDGRIVFKGRKGGYGRTVIIKHGTAYNTLYAHMNSFNRRARYGSRVKQGQIIGYVGSSGLATGPHLHYEFRLNGVHRNPLTIRLPKASSLPKQYRANFKKKAQELVSQLNLIKHNTLALNTQ